MERLAAITGAETWREQLDMVCWRTCHANAMDMTQQERTLANSMYLTSRRAELSQLLLGDVVVLEQELDAHQLQFYRNRI